MADILHRVGIKSSLDEVCKALTTREGLAAWWTNNTQGKSSRRSAPIPLWRRRFRHESS
jgi:hypothetical protein